MKCSERKVLQCILALKAAPVTMKANNQKMKMKKLDPPYDLCIPSFGFVQIAHPTKFESFYVFFLLQWTSNIFMTKQSRNRQYRSHPPIENNKPMETFQNKEI